MLTLTFDIAPSYGIILEPNILTEVLNNGQCSGHIGATLLYLDRKDFTFSKGHSPCFWFLNGQVGFCD